MKSLVINALLGVLLGRYASAWSLALFVPIVAAEVAYAVVVHVLEPADCLRHGAALFVVAELAFVLGVLLRPAPGETAD